MQYSQFQATIDAKTKTTTIILALPLFAIRLYVCVSGCECYSRRFFFFVSVSCARCASIWALDYDYHMHFDFHVKHILVT